MVGIKLKTSHMLGRFSINELFPMPKKNAIYNYKINAIMMSYRVGTVKNSATKGRKDKKCDMNYFQMSLHYSVGIHNHGQG